MNNWLSAGAFGLLPTLAIMATYWFARRENKHAAVVVAAKLAIDTAELRAETGAKLEEIHVLVNSRLSEALNRIEDLERSLGIPADAPAPPPSQIPSG